jgi:hypothetical protein
VASRADPSDLPEAPNLPAAGIVAPAPTIGGTVRRSLQDAYYNSWRLLPANVVWSATLIALLTALVVTPFALLLVPLLALPTAGLFRVTTRIVRGEAVSFWDAIDAWRTGIRVTLVAGAGLAAAAAVFFANVMTGLSSTSPLGWILATLAAWGLVVMALLVWTLWPILLDPHRAAWPASQRARLAALLLLAHPIRIGALAVTLSVFLVVSALAIVALVTISLAFAALVASRFVLPAADRLEADLAARGGARVGADDVA